MKRRILLPLGLIVGALLTASCESPYGATSNADASFHPGVDGSLISSEVTASPAVIGIGLQSTVTLTLYDDQGNRVPTLGQTVTFSYEGGTSTGTFSSTADNGDGSYTSLFTATGDGSPINVHAKIGGDLVTSAAPTLQVNDHAPSSLSYTPNPAVYIVGNGVNIVPSFSGGAPISYTISPPTLPSGMSFNSSSGVISGTATTPTAAGTFNITAANSGGTSSPAALSITVNSPVPVVPGTGTPPTVSECPSTTAGTLSVPVIYSDAVGDLATSCVVSAQSSDFQGTASCSCSAGSCTVTGLTFTNTFLTSMTPGSNSIINGALTYTVTAAGGTSASGSENITVTGSSWTPNCLGSGVALWLDAKTTSSITITYQTTGATGTGAMGASTITSSSALSLPVGAQIYLGTDTLNIYKMTAISGTTITVTPSLVSAYSAKTIYLGKVSQWNDRSSNARNATQTIVADQPVYANSTVVFQGYPEFLTTGLTLTGMTTGNAAAFYGAVETLTGAVYTGIINARVTGGNNTGLIILSTPSTFGMDWLTNGLYASGPTRTATVGTTNVVGAINLGATQNISINGSLSTATTITTSNVGSSATTLFNIGCDSSGSTRYWGGIGSELLVYGGVLSTTNRQQLEGYLAWRWGIEGNLSTSPYMSAAP
jgi:hypothetical protein